jgi:hypothetical protein
MAYRKKSEEAHARVLATRRNAPPPAKGNTRTLKSGARSRNSLALAPVRERHLAELSRDYPKLDSRRLVLLADRMARIEASMDWLDKNGLVRNAKGDPHPLVKFVERWATRAENLLEAAEHEHRSGPLDLATALSENEADDAA